MQSVFHTMMRLFLNIKTAGQFLLLAVDCICFIFRNSFKIYDYDCTIWN